MSVLTTVALNGINFRDIFAELSMSHFSSVQVMQDGHRVDIIDHRTIIDHFAEMVDILEFVVDISLKWSIFHQNLSKW